MRDNNEGDAWHLIFWACMMLLLTYFVNKHYLNEDLDLLDKRIEGSKNELKKLEH